MTSTTLREMLVKQEPRSVTCCYVCSGSRAEYWLCSKPFRDNPFFPFLEQHQPPDGAENMRSDGRVSVCYICYSFLNQQWESHERSKTPYNKRIYWLKRLDGGPFAGMDVNLQQDYESLFDSSSAAFDTEYRSRPKHNRSHPSSETDGIRSKPSEGAENYSNSFNFSSQSAERTENILDLSITTRGSSSTSPSVSSEVCYTCGQEAKTLLFMFVKYVRNCPCFPTLASLPKLPRAKPIDTDGRIFVCNHCHGSLLQQFDSFQKQNVPIHERMYQVGIESHKQEVVEKSFVCYTCGMVSQVSAQRSISTFSEKSGEPYFSFLLNVPPHPGASKLTNGKAAVCSICYKTFFRQFKVYEVSNTPEEKRKYKLLNESVTVRHQPQDNSFSEHEFKAECYLCEIICDSLVLIDSLPLSDIYFPFIKSLSKPAGSFPMDTHGRVKVCGSCKASLVYQWNAFEHAAIPVDQRQYKILPASKLHIEGNHYEPKPVKQSLMPSDLTKTVIIKEEYDCPVKKTSTSICGLCGNVINIDSVYYLETLPRNNTMYFPSLRNHAKSNFVDVYGRIQACGHCFLFLKNQFEVFESAHVPHSQRQYEIFPPKSEKDRISHFSSDCHLSETSAALHIQVSSPDLKIEMTKLNSSNIEPLLTTVNTLPINSFTVSNAAISSASNSPHLSDMKSSTKTYGDESIPRISGPLDVPPIRPLILIPITCYVCGELNSTGVTYPIRTKPAEDIQPDKSVEDVPFFPFLAKHHPVPEGAENLSSDGTALACMFCYHSLVSQWLAYESSFYPEDSNPWLRRYNTHNYVCYICSVTTYRRRVCSISVKDFPFLLEHSRPAGALTLINGECVITCQTCFESITSQWKDFERMKVPVEMRKYNWITVPPPPDDENSRGCQILQENVGLLSASQSENDSTHTDDGVPHGLKSGTSHLPLPAPYGVSKPLGRNVISPQSFSPYPLNPALNATRTSSFAAALRKLAKQAVDPIAEKDLSPISPASSPASSHGRHLPVYTPSSAAPPPLHSSQGKALDLGRYSSGHRNGEPMSLKMDSSKMTNDKRRDEETSRGQHNMPPTFRPEHSLSRGFQPYRNAEERRPTPPQVYNPSPPPTNYPYHTPYAPRMQTSYRLEESAYMERYGLLRPSTLPYPNMIPHSRPNLYSSNQYPHELPMRTSNRYNHEDENSKESVIRKRDVTLYRDPHERYMEREEMENREREFEYMRKERLHRRHSPVPQQLPMEDRGVMGSITQGTPRDYPRSLSPPPASAPLNLATSVNENPPRRPTPANGHNRKDSELPYKMPYTLSQESEPKPPQLKPAYAKKPAEVETRTLSIAAVIDSQINGMLAREKFQSKSSYDYITSFEKNTGPTSQVESEFKKLLAAHEPYARIEASNRKSDPPPPQRVEEADEGTVSVLDAREAKMRKLRADAVESEESGIESDGEDAQRLKELLTIRKGPVPPMQPTPKKTSFLSQFDLVTHSKRQMVELRKLSWRRKVLRERSLSPLNELPVKTDTVEYDEAHLAQLSERLCYADDFRAKTDFFRSFGLSQVPPEEKPEKAKIQRIVEEERLRRKGLLAPSQQCIDLQGFHLGKRVSVDSVRTEPFKKQHIAPDENTPPHLTPADQLKIEKKDPPSLPVQRISSFMKPPIRTGHMPPPLIPTYQALSMTNCETAPEKSSIVAPKDPRVRNFNKDFVQEFHNSVLQTTQMQMAEKKGAHPQTSEKVECPMPWPGIEAIMESYEFHISDQSNEKQFLLERCQKLRAMNEESNNQVACLATRTDELLQEKKSLDLRSREIQTKIETIQMFIRRFR